MVPIDWHLLENQMLNSTDRNYKRAMVLDRFHMSNLIRVALIIPEYIPIRDRYLAKSTPLRDDYSIWKSAGNVQASVVLNMTQKLKLANKSVHLISTNLGLIAGFEPGTVGYISVFTHGLYPFNSGTEEEKVAAYLTTANNCGSNLTLAPFKAALLTLHSNLTGNKTDLTIAHGTTNTGSSNLETSRINAMTMQQRDLGFALDFSWDDHALIQSMFDVETMMEHHQSLFTGHLNSLEIEGPFRHGYLATDTMDVESHGASAIGVWLASAHLGKDSDMVTINSNQRRPILISEFGAINLDVNREVTVQALSTTLETQYRIHL